jgi:lipoate-protein ligase B
MNRARLSVRKMPRPLSFAEGLSLQRQAAELLEQDPHRRAVLFLLEHHPVYTLGRKTLSAHLAGVNAAALARKTNAEVVETDRGGSVTYHGPGQVTAYLHLNLKVWAWPMHEHLNRLEDAGIRALQRFGLEGRRRDGLTGVWVRCSPKDARVVVAVENAALADDPGWAKVCAIGVAARRWVTYHGLGLNVEGDLAPFTRIIPCGLAGEAITNLGRLLKRPVEFAEAAEAVAEAVAEVLDAQREDAT